MVYLVESVRMAAVLISRLFAPFTSIITRKFRYAPTNACSGTITRYGHSSTSFAGGAVIVVPEGGRTITAEWSSGRPPSTFHSTWLRHNCQCSVCVTSSGQKSTASTDLDPSTTVTHARLTGKVGYCLVIDFACELYNTFVSFRVLFCMFDH